MSRWQLDMATHDVKHRAQAWRLDLQARLWDRSRKKAAKLEFPSKHRHLPEWPEPSGERAGPLDLLGTLFQAVLHLVPLMNWVAFLQGHRSTGLD